MNDIEAREHIERVILRHHAVGLVAIGPCPRPFPSGILLRRILEYGPKIVRLVWRALHDRL